MRRIFGQAGPAQLLILSALILSFTVTLIFPLFSLLSKAFFDKSGAFAGIRNYIDYFGTPSLSVSIRNTAEVSSVTAVFSVLLGLAYAYALTRTNIRGKAFFRYTALIPIFLPTVVHALGLVYIFGRQGILTGLGVETELYGRFGVILSEIIFTFPQAFLMFAVALEVADGRLYEAADSMGVSAVKRFFGITLPDIKYTVVNAFFVCFTLAFTDFGAPKVLGGGYNVLATDIYKQIAGQFNMNMGAVVGTLLLLPAVASFAVGQIVTGRNTSTVSSKATKLSVADNRPRDAVFFVFCSAVSACFLFLIAALCMGALTEYYPYNMAPTLRHFGFNASAGGIESYFNSLEMSLLTAVFGTAFVFVYAYMLEKTRGFDMLRRYGRLLSVLPLALPGMVVGVSFIFFFNARSNPLHFIYGTVVILVLSNILHYFSVPFVTATGSLKKLDREFESVSDSMSVIRVKTFLRVSLPLSLPAVLEIFMYYFVNSMVTVSAVVFLYGAKFKIASIAITHMEEAGDISQAAAMSLLILLINAAVRIAYAITANIIERKNL
ncbi:MAG: putative 2-aminoethylphosphonate ABC transporter permease subunit [Clostridiales Family XIII bacterium]|jgi:iron(III) transport system permease protein|nr:putative 2-aminoethylphosphonate ABC transporter permease subunit [Clostridiales Family XIII bacterium]